MFGHKKFDVVVMNPPYDNPNNAGGSTGYAKKLWMQFVEEAVASWLVPSGYLVCVHPSSWRAQNSNMWKPIYQSKQVVIAKLNPNVAWDVGVKTDWYVLQNCDYTKPTSVIYSIGTEPVDFRQYDGLADDLRIEKIRLKLTGEKLHFESTTSHHASGKRVSEKGTYPIQHTAIQVLRSFVKHAWQDLKKVLVSCSGYLEPFYDDGKLGVTQTTAAHFVSSKQEADYIIRLLNSKLYRFIVQSYKTSGFTHIKLLNLLPYPKTLRPNFTDAELYKHFNLTDDEIELIERTVK